MTDNETMIIDAFAELPSDRREITLAACVAIDRVIGRREKKAREELGRALEKDARCWPQLWVDPASLNRAENGTEITLPVPRGTEDAYDLPMTVEAMKEYVAKPLAPEIDPKETAAGIAQGNVMASPARVRIIGDGPERTKIQPTLLRPILSFKPWRSWRRLRRAGRPLSRSRLPAKRRVHPQRGQERTRMPRCGHHRSTTPTT